MTQTMTTGSIGPVLSDGTPLGDLIDLDTREVSLRLLSDPEVYELELEHLFAKTWIILAHESEIPEPGDYVMRNLGADPVIVTRTRAGTIEVLLNVCTHRGMQVCRAEVGNATKFRCPYHGWVFGPDGSFLAAPFEKEMYGDVLDKGSLGLQRARVATYGGMIFANWSEEAPSLDEHLGDYRWYLDTMFNRTDLGLEVVGTPQRSITRANWKTQGEQFAADGYHIVTMHRSMFEMAMIGLDKVDIDARAMAMYGVDVSVPQGHGIRCMAPPQFLASGIDPSTPPIDVLMQFPPPGVPRELVPQLAKHLSEGQLRTMISAPPAAGGMFPNVGILNAYAFSPDFEPGVGHLVVHTFVPTAYNVFENTTFVLVEKGASDDYKRQAYRSAIVQFGINGMIEEDDMEAYPSMQLSATGFQGRKKTMKYQALLGENKPADWAGGGLVYDGFTKDDTQWNWWKAYYRTMVGEF